MAIMVVHCERRDGADRAEMAEAAYSWCCALRGGEGIRNSRFFWVTPDRIAVLTEADALADLDRLPKPDTAAAMFHLADVARVTYQERWYDPEIGEETYRMAGRDA